MKRDKIEMDRLDRAIADCRSALAQRLAQHGPGIAAGSHEVLGLLAEEYHEFLVEVTANNKFAQIRELEDIAVVCLFGIASLKQQMDTAKL